MTSTGVGVGHRRQRLLDLGVEGGQLGQVGVGGPAEGGGVDAVDLRQPFGQGAGGGGHLAGVGPQVGVDVVLVVPVAVAAELVALALAVGPGVLVAGRGGGPGGLLALVLLGEGQQLDVVGDGEDRRAVGLDRLDDPLHALLEVGAVDDDEVGPGHVVGLARRQARLVGVGAPRHEHVDRRLVAHEVLDHVAEHGRRDDDRGAVTGRAGAAAARRQRPAGQGDASERER